MLTRLALRNFQSHASTELELGQFTVIVGASSSGKSAVVRALSLLARNARGTSYVRHGASTCVVEAEVQQFAGDPPEAGIHVAIQRGKGSEYRLKIPDQNVERFTKIGTSTPSAITEALDFGFDEMWLAGQFDRPFLLDATGSAVAKTLGDLTNVSLIFAAVRECARRASAAKTRHADRSAALLGARERVMAFSALPGQRDAMDRTEAVLGAARSLDRRVVTLRDLLAEVSAATVRWSDAQKLLAPVPEMHSLRGLVNHRSALVSTLGSLTALPLPSPVPDLPDTTELLTMKARAVALRAAVRDAAEAAAHAEASRGAVLSAEAETATARSDFAAALTAAGRCPLCGTATS